METRKGIPITFAVLYISILRRVGVIADIIGLTGHVALGLPGDGRRTFVRLSSRRILISGTMPSHCRIVRICIATIIFTSLGCL
jgi:hypothetical protein